MSFAQKNTLLSPSKCDNEGGYATEDYDDDEDRESPSGHHGVSPAGGASIISHPTPLHPRFPLGIPLGPVPGGGGSGVWPGGASSGLAGPTGSPFPWLPFRSPGMGGPGGSKYTKNIV